ncbi:MAG: peptide ABC transporter ATP-binding protein [Candidatus Rokuibacteriota bacterium]|nr:MAG: peptide ABC transporter ATP-binding protein [Candidatus Rokubacteria bacterium]
MVGRPEMPPPAPALLETRDLRTHFRRGGLLAPVRWLRAVDGVSLAVLRQETLGLVGESGSGKTTFGRTILRLVEPTGGRILLDGRDITHLSPRELRPLRRRMQIVFQNPYASLNPRKRVRQIVGQPLAVHGWEGDRDARVADLLERVGLPRDAGHRYPHEFSGGQRQRIAIARALALRPDLVVADEITSGLDVTVKSRVVALLRELRLEFHVAYLFISHDLAVVRQIADRVAVMYLGQIVEEAPAEALFAGPLHPYTRALQASVPPPDPDVPWVPPILAGEPPSPLAVPRGCRFHPRCPVAEARCRIEPPALRELAPGHRAACHLAG